ncbi:MAG: DUF5011 domain-containing protein [Bacteroidia bacterium]|nr:DUF5011 domain-containing protein [Bacteroidia bacterium]
MKKMFTTLRNNAHHFYLWIAVVLFSFLPRIGISQQIAIDDFIKNSSPYCNAPHNNTASNNPCSYPGTGYNVYLEKMELGNYYHDEGPTCRTIRSSYSYFNEMPIQLVTNATPYTLKVTIPQTNVGWARGVGVWFDFNGDNKFSDSEFLDQGVNFSTYTPKTVFERKILINCGMKPGIYRLRIRTDYNTAFSASQACVNPYGYGETWDFDVQVIASPKVEKAPDFLVPANVYVNTPVTFKNNSYKLSWPFIWDWDLNGPDATTVDYTLVPLSVGAHSLKLKIQGCGTSDSVTKTINVKTPSQKPGTDFYSNRTIIEEFDEIILKDISSDGPTSWDWTISNSAYPDLTNVDGTPLGLGGRYNITKFMLQDMGLFDVCLNATNNVGSFQRCKLQYIEVVPFSEFKLGAGLTATSLGSGTIFDKGGPNANYQTGANGDPSVCRLRIQPCGAKTITLNVTQFKFAQVSHNLKVWDGPNPSFGTPLHPAGGFNPSNSTQPFQVIATSGAMYMELDTKTSGSTDSGLIATFTTDYGVLGAPVPSIGIGENQPVAYTNAITMIKSTSKNISGIPEYYWQVDDVDVLPSAYLGDGEAFKYNFNTAGTYKISLWIKSDCLQGVGDFDIYGDPIGSGFVQYITVVDPTSPTNIDFVANNRRPDAYTPIIVSSITDKANKFLWSIEPANKFTYDFGSNNTSQDLRGSFTEAGTYNITLSAWNSNDSAMTGAVLTKQAYIAVVDYCVPSAQIVSSDVSVNNVKISSGNDVIFSQNTSSGSVAYESFISPSSTVIPMVLGGNYTVTVTRASVATELSHAVFIDFNGDGFFDSTERVLRVINSSDLSSSAGFTVPDFNVSFTESPVRMRVVSAFHDQEPSACGPLSVGEFEDYLVKLITLNNTPMLTLNGNSTTYTEQGLPYVDEGATATDSFEGDISSRIEIDSDLDPNTVGIYHITYNVKNSSGVSASPVTRTVIVTADNTPPVLTLLGNNPDTIEVLSGTYSEPGYTSIDALDGDITAQVIVSSNLNEDKLGTYQITYSSTDVAGNNTTKTRTVVVVDTEAPVILPIGSNLVDLGKFWYDQTSVTDNYWASKDIYLTKEYGVNGPVRWDVKGVYQVKYIAVDGSGNSSELTRTYIVDDYTAPMISLNTADTIIHDVNSPYTPVQPVISDNSYASNTLDVEYNTNLNVNKLGLYSETYKVTDGSGNTTIKARWISVVDRVSPFITSPSICSKVGIDFNSKSTLTVTDNYYSSEVLYDLIQTVYSNVNPYEVGSYNVTYSVTDPSGNISNIAKQQVIIAEDCDLVTSVNDIQSNLSVNVYPNPSNSGLFIVDFGNSKQNISRIDIVNSIGVKIAQYSNAEIVNGKLNVDISNYSQGIYVLNVQTERGNVSVKLMMIK